MRIAFLHPTYWPEVRRGSERIVHDLGAALAERGHEVTLLTTHRARRTVTTEDGIRVDRAWRPPSLPPLRWYEQYLVTIPAAIARLRSGAFDLAHAFFPADAYAAARARRLGGPPFVFSIHGLPTREYLVARRYRLEMLKEAIAAAAATTVLSEAAAELVRRYLLAEPVVVPGGVDVDAFRSDEPRSETPKLLCASSLSDPRKRAPLLLEAFADLREQVPDGRLVLAGGADMPDYGDDGLGLPPGVARVDADRTEVLAGEYASAWASVLPSVEEAFGLVLVESLAAGTPVLGARSGGVPEIVTNERIGRVFGPDSVTELADAMREALRVAPDAAAADACRERARDFDWPVVADRVEGIYRGAVGAAA